MSSVNGGPSQTTTTNLQPLTGAFDQSGKLVQLYGPGGVPVPYVDPSNVDIRGGVIAILGDSIAAQCYSVSPSAWNPAGLTTSFTARSWLGWLLALSGNSLVPVYIGGVSGERTDQILARADTALASGAKWLIEQGGTNDVSQYVAAYGTAAACVAGVVANRAAIWAKAQGQGVMVIALAVPPVTSATTFDATQQSLVPKINRALREAARTTRNVIFVDTFSELVDPTSASGYAVTAANFDPIHPSAQGAYLMGQRIWKSIKGRVSPYTGAVSSQRDCIQQDAANKNILAAADGMFLSGTAGTVGTGVTGTVATNWTCSRITGTAGTAVASVIASPDGIGNAQRLVISGAASGDTFRWLAFAGSNLTQLPAGSRVCVEAVIRVTSPVNFGGVYVASELQFTGGAGTSPQIANGLPSQFVPTDPAISNVDLGGTTEPFIIRTPYAVLPSDATALSQVRAQIYASFGGAGGSATVDVYRVSMVKE